MNVVCFDLDDTIFNEVEYLKSAFREIIVFAFAHKYNRSNIPFRLYEKAYDLMMNAFLNKANAFMQLNEFLELHIPIDDYLHMYRNHYPKISLSYENEALFQLLKAKGDILGIITDGRKKQQQCKIEALHLERYFNETDIIISEEFGSEKPSEPNYRYFMSRYPYADRYFYIGDNIKKDFYTPNRLGWITIGLKDNGCNIHPQRIDNIPTIYYPAKWVNSLKEIITIIHS